MKRISRVFPMIAGAIAWGALSHAQEPPWEPGKSIGSVSTHGNLIVVTLNDRVLGRANLFDLAGRTVRFTPDGAGYRVETGALKWDAEFGSELTGGQVAEELRVSIFGQKLGFVYGRRHRLDSFRRPADDWAV